MAGVDEIDVLDGIQFQKETTSDVYTLDGDGLEAVKTYAIFVPTSAKAARVIFNGAYDPDGGRIHYRVKGIGVTDISTPTKTANTQINEWTTLTPPAVAESGVWDTSGLQMALLCVDIALSSTSANTGVEVICQYRKEDALDEWTDILGGRFIGPTGTASKSDFAAQEVVGQTTLSVTNPVAGNLNHPGKFIFLEDTATIAQCEIAYIVTCGTDS